MVNSTTACAMAKNSQTERTETSELFKLLDEMKNGKIADDDYEMHTRNLCDTLKTVSSKILEEIGDAEEHLAKSKTSETDYHARRYEAIQYLTYQIETLALIIDERISEYQRVPDIFFLYKDEYVKGN